MFRPRHIQLSLGLFIMMTACRKEHRDGVPPMLGEHLQFSVDSCCVQAPNVFTPNSDGIDDVFRTYSSNVSTFSLEIRSASNVKVFSSTDPELSWNGVDTSVSDSSPTAGRYTYTIEVMSTSGAHFIGNYDVYVIPDLSSPCFSSRIAPVFGDQFDPRQCGPVYPSNDAICMQ